MNRDSRSGQRKRNTEQKALGNLVKSQSRLIVLKELFIQLNALGKER